MNYYAEHDTDKILREKYFPNIDYKGILIEVGGATPEFLSMSKHFKDSGWRTIIIEPNPDFAKQHRDVGNEVFEMACSFEDKKDASFTIVQQNVSAYSGTVTDHSFSSLEIKEEYINKTGINLNNMSTKQIKVDVVRLQTLLESLQIKRIDILSIDVEGWEIEVMRGLDVSSIKCDIVVLENLFHNEYYNDYMKSIGFNLLEKIEYNYVYKFSNW